MSYTHFTCHVLLIIDHVFIFALLSLIGIISGNLTYSQANLLPSAKERNLISTTSETNITALLDIPFIYKKSNITYEWDINNHTIIENTTNFILFNFTKSQVNNISLLVTAVRQDLPIINATGLFTLNLTSVEPISNISLDGKTFTPRYETLNLKLDFLGGEPPFFYCWELTHISINDSMGTNSRSCDVAFTRGFKIVHYFSIKGKYNLSVEVENSVTKLTRAWTISIYEGKLITILH